MRRLFSAAVLSCLVAGEAAAQSTDPALRPHQLTLVAGFTWAGGYAIGDQTAALRRNEAGTLSPGPYTLFRAESSLARTTGAEARIGFALTPALAVEFTAAFAKPRLVVDISEDAESEPTQLADERIAQYGLDANVNWQLPRIRLSSHARLYALAGGGYLRQLYADRVRIAAGSVAYAGGGVRYWLRGGDRSSRAVGLRAEARLQMRRRGIEFAGQSRHFPVVSVMAFVGL